MVQIDYITGIIEDKREITFFTTDNKNRILTSVDNDGIGCGFVHTKLEIKIVIHGRMFVPQNWIKSKTSLKDLRTAIKRYLAFLKMMPGGKQVLEQLNSNLEMRKEDFDSRWTAD